MEGIPVGPWTIFDILGVVFSVFVITILFYITSKILIRNERVILYLFRYVFPLLTLFAPIIWIRKRYGLSIDVLGIRRGHLNISSLLFTGIITALLYTLFLRLSPFWRDSALSQYNVSKYYIHLMLLPFSLTGLSMCLLGPISEEVMFRGLLYGYFRRKLGVFLGIILQALIFTILHSKNFQLGIINGNISYLIFSPFLIGVILGILYEKTGSIYPSIICHGTFNYLIVILSMVWK